MMTGRPPFEEAKKSDFLYKCIIANRPDIFWRTHKKYMRNEKVIDEDIQGLLFQMLHADASKRPSL